MSRSNSHKSVLYRLFRVGRIPPKVKATLEQEGIVLADEGIPGWYITKNFRAPGKRFVNRSEGFTGCLVITSKRVVCYTFSKPQINIAIDDPRITNLYYSMPGKDILSISFDSMVFKDEWEGIIELQFKTPLASEFYEKLQAITANLLTTPESANEPA